MSETAKHRTIRYLQDAHSAEVGIEDVLEGFIDDTIDVDIKALFEEHREVTRGQAIMLEGRLKELGGEPSGGKSFLNTLMAKVSEVMHSAHEEYDKNVQNLIKAYSVEHLERGMYESLYAFCMSIGDAETAALAKVIQGQEEEAAAKLFPMIQQYANASFGAPNQAYTA